MTAAIGKKYAGDGWCYSNLINIEEEEQQLQLPRPALSWEYFAIGTNSFVPARVHSHLP